MLVPSSTGKTGRLTSKRSLVCSSRGYFEDETKHTAHSDGGSVRLYHVFLKYPWGGWRPFTPLQQDRKARTFTGFKQNTKIPFVCSVIAVANYVSGVRLDEALSVGCFEDDVTSNRFLSVFFFIIF